MKYNYNLLNDCLWNCDKLIPFVLCYVYKILQVYIQRREFIHNYFKIILKIGENVNCDFYIFKWFENKNCLDFVWLATDIWEHFYFYDFGIYQWSIILLSSNEQLIML